MVVDIYNIILLKERDMQLQVHSDESKYYFSVGSAIVAILEKFENTQFFPENSECLRIKEGLRVNLYSHVSNEILALILSFISLKDAM